MESYAPRLQDLLVDLQLVTTSQINEALFISGVSSVLGALEHYLPPPDFKALLQSVAGKLGMFVQEFSPRAFDRNIDLRDPEKFKSLVQQYRSLPLKVEGEGQSAAVILAVTDPLNDDQFHDWSGLYGMKINALLVSESDLRKFTLALSSKLPLASRPKLDETIRPIAETNNHDPEIVQIIGELIVASARRNLDSISLINSEGIIHVSILMGTDSAEWRIPIVFEKAASWLASLRVETNDEIHNASLHRDDLEIRFSYEQSDDVVHIIHPRFYIGEIDGIESEVEQIHDSAEIIIAADREDTLPFSWKLLRNDPSVKLSRNRSDTLITALIDRPSIIIVDYEFPELNAIELLKDLSGNLSSAKVLVVLPENKLELGHGLTHAGADHCVPTNQLEQTIKACLRELPEPR